ncbi:MAG: CusA/CzcA family heavy metal efflux RND transporter [Flavobacteriales bacterium]
MINRLITFSIQHKAVVMFLSLMLIAGGLWSLRQLPIDAVPDITNNQVQVITVSPSLAPQEMEKYVTQPLEFALRNIPNTTDIRSITRFGLSVITIVFDEDVPNLEARQFVNEQISSVKDQIPEQFGTAELMPITTGLGEIYQYQLKVDPAYKSTYSLEELRTIQDWTIKRQLSGIEGLIEVSSYGGKLKEYEVALNLEALKTFNIDALEVSDALERSNENMGASYLERHAKAYYIRSEGLVNTLEDIENIVVKVERGTPVLIKDVADVRMGSANRLGAMTANGTGEIVGGIALMYKGENSVRVIDRIKEKVEQINTNLPDGIQIEAFLDRSDLIDRTASTIKTNLTEAALIVIFILVLLLGNFRAGLIVASVIPMSLLFAFCLMNAFGVSANIMSLGAVDFGLVLDGSIIVVEATLHQLYSKKNRTLSQSEMDSEVLEASSGIRKSAAFGEIIILIVYLPILVLVGIEGKMFQPMALTVGFAILGALILSLTYVPMMSALFLKKEIVVRRGLAERLMTYAQRLYLPVLNTVFKFKKLVIAATIALFLGSLALFSTLGGEFIPTLEEGDLALQLSLNPETSLNQTMKTTAQVERILLDEFPEVKQVISKIGTAEIPTDPMGIGNVDVMIVMKEKDDWVSAKTREGMQSKMKHALEKVIGVNLEMTQPIQLRFNELISGSKSDIAIKLFGENLDVLVEKAVEIGKLVADIEGVGDVNVDQVSGLSQLVFHINRKKIAEYGLYTKDVNRLIKTIYSGQHVSVVYEDERRFDMVVRLDAEEKNQVSLEELFLKNNNNQLIPLSELVDIETKKGANSISREQAKRRVNIGINARNRDIESLINDIDKRIKTTIDLPSGYYIDYGGQFENLQTAKNRLAIAVPAALAFILLLLYITFGNFKQALLIFSAVPLAAIGGIWALHFRSMPFSISAGIGFIALFGVAVLDGIVLISSFNKLKIKSKELKLWDLITLGSKLRLRPVLLTSLVASFGFLPMALSTQAGSEVQRPLATVVIGGLVSATMLTLLVLPILYYFLEKKQWKIKAKPLAVSLLILISGSSFAQNQITENQFINLVLEHNTVLNQQQIELKNTEDLKSKTWSLGDTELGWQYGELNKPLDQDQSFSVVQNIKNPWQSRLQRKQLSAEVNHLTHQQAILEAEQVKTASLLFNAFSAEQNKLKLSLALITKFEELLQFSRKQLEAGEISKFELKLIENQAQKLQIELSFLNQKIDAIVLKMSELCLVKLQASQLKSAFELRTLDLSKALELSPDFRSWAKQKQAAAELGSRVNNTRFPSIGLSYQLQDIEEQSSKLSSFGFVLSFNGFSDQFRTNKRKALAALHTQGLETRQVLENKSQALEQHIQRAKQVGTQLNGLQHISESDYEDLKTQVQLGAISLSEYLMILNQFRSQNLEQIEFKKQYNDLIIRIKSLI